MTTTSLVVRFIALVVLLALSAVALELIALHLHWSAAIVVSGLVIFPIARIIAGDN